MKRRIVQIATSSGEALALADDGRVFQLRRWQEDGGRFSWIELPALPDSDTPDPQDGFTSEEITP